MNYGELKTAIEAYMHRSDLTDQIEGFVVRAEQKIGRDARLLENRVQDTVTPSSGAAALPTRFAEMRRVSTGSGSSLRILKPISANDANQYGSSGNALAYYISDQIYLVPSSDTDIDIDYYEYPESLAGAGNGATRPILDRYESLYINAAMAEAKLYVEDYEGYATWSQRYTAEVMQANTRAAQAYRPVTASQYGFNTPVAGGL